MRFVLKVFWEGYKVIRHVISTLYKCIELDRNDAYHRSCTLGDVVGVGVGGEEGENKVCVNRPCIVLTKQPNLVKMRCQHFARVLFP